MDKPKVGDIWKYTSSKEWKHDGNFLLIQGEMGENVGMYGVWFFNAICLETGQKTYALRMDIGNIYARKTGDSWEKVA